MELRHIRYFDALAEELHFSRAAERVNITQSTLSHQIRQLEEDLGASLFDRSGRVVRLSAAGREFVVHAKRILREASSARLAVSELQGLARGSLRVGVIHTYSRNVMVPTLARFVAAYPGVHVALEELTTPEIEAGLVGGALDIGVAVAPARSEEIMATPIRNEAYVLILGRDHPSSGIPSILFREAAALPLAMLTTRFSTRRLIDRHFDAMHIRPDVKVESNAIEALIDLVSRTKLASILPESIIRSDDAVTATLLQDPTPRRACALFLRAGFRPSPAAEALAAMLGEQG